MKIYLERGAKLKTDYICRSTGEALVRHIMNGEREFDEGYFTYFLEVASAHGWQVFVQQADGKWLYANAHLERL